MDIARPDLAVKKRRKRILLAVLAVGALGLMTAWVARLEPAAPAVDKDSLLMDTVKRGEMLLQVRGPGVLLPEEIRWIPTVNQGRVDRICVLPGAAVTADTVLVELSNPEVEQAAFDAQFALQASEAEMTNLKVQLQSQHLNQQASVASAQAGYNNAQLEAEVNTALSKDGLIPGLTLKQSLGRAEELGKLLAIEQERLKISGDAAKAQAAVQTAKVEQLRATLELRRRQVEGLRIRAGIDGVLQRLGDTAVLQVGQQLAPGANVARVANPTRLKAEIRIGEVQARDVQLGQPVVVDLRSSTMRGRVVRVDPAVQNGTVTVDVKLEGALPRGARPDLSVDGTIELDRLPDVKYVGPPVGGRSESTVGLFKVVEGGREAVRVPVRLGKNSVTAIEVTEGLEVGDRVILSDMSQWDAHARVRLN